MGLSIIGMPLHEALGLVGWCLDVDYTNLTCWSRNAPLTVRTYWLHGKSESATWGRVIDHVALRYWLCGTGLLTKCMWQTYRLRDLNVLSIRCWHVSHIVLVLAKWCRCVNLIISTKTTYQKKKSFLLKQV